MAMLNKTNEELNQSIIESKNRITELEKNIKHVREARQFFAYAEIEILKIDKMDLLGLILNVNKRFGYEIKDAENKIKFHNDRIIEIEQELVRRENIKAANTFAAAVNKLAGILFRKEKKCK